MFDPDSPFNVAPTRAFAPSSEGIAVPVCPLRRRTVRAPSAVGFYADWHPQRFAGVKVHRPDADVWHPDTYPWLIAGAWKADVAGRGE